MRTCDIGIDRLLPDGEPWYEVMQTCDIILGTVGLNFEAILFFYEFV